MPYTSNIYVYINQAYNSYAYAAKIYSMQ